jgi:glycosyltransferase involved in cell wall biosynthesis
MTSTLMSVNVGPERSQLSSLKLVHAAETITGGIASYLRDLVRLQLLSCHAGQITVVAPASQCDFLRPAGNVQIVGFDDRGGRLTNALRMARKVQEVVSLQRPHVVHAHSTFAGAVLRPKLSLRRNGVSLIYCPHGWAFERGGSQFTRRAAQWVERGLAPHCDAIVCISGHELQTARRHGIPEDKLVLVRNGVSQTAPTPLADQPGVAWPPGVRRVLFIGRFDKQKGVDVLARAIARLQGKAFAYLIGGSVVGGTVLTSVPPNAKVCGWMSAAQLESFYKSADVIVIPSRWEGFSLTATEAMRAGLPVIASRVGGLAEVVHDGVTGALFPPENEDALVETLLRLTDRQLRAMGEAGRQRVLEHFTMDRVHNELCELYSRCPAATMPVGEYA